MRLFTAIELPPAVIIRLERLISALRPEALINWSPLDNLHITTKFIGEWSESRLDEVRAALASLPHRDSFDIEVRDLGWFPNERSARVLWAGVQSPEELRRLAQETQDCLVSLGIPKEDREYAPHLTVARIRRPVPLQPLRRRVADLRETSFGTVRVSQFNLYQSVPGSNASVYRNLEQFTLEKSVAAAKI